MIFAQYNKLLDGLCFCGCVINCTVGGEFARTREHQYVQCVECPDVYRDQEDIQDILDIMQCASQKSRDVMDLFLQPITSGAYERSRTS